MRNKITTQARFRLNRFSHFHIFVTLLLLS